MGSIYIKIEFYPLKDFLKEWLDAIDDMGCDELVSGGGLV